MVAAPIKTGTVNDSLVNFTGILSTCLELAGARSMGTTDGIILSAQLAGTPSPARAWAHTLQVRKNLLREAKWKLRESGELHYVRHASYAETWVCRGMTPPNQKSRTIACKRH